MNALATVIIAFLTFPFLAMWRAYVIIVMWGWFITPATNIAAPTIYVLVGTLMVLTLILSRQKAEPPTDDPLSDYLGHAFTWGLLYPALSLGTGWVWRWLQWGVVA